MCSIETITSLLELLTIPSAFHVTSANARAKLAAVLTNAGAVSYGDGRVIAGLSQVHDYLVKPRLGAAGNTTAKIVINPLLQFTGRLLRFTYNVSVVDTKGTPHMFGRFKSVATFLPCSSKVESLYSSSEIGRPTLRALREAW